MNAVRKAQSRVADGNKYFNRSGNDDRRRRAIRPRYFTVARRAEPARVRLASVRRCPGESGAVSAAVSAAHGVLVSTAPSAPPPDRSSPRAPPAPSTRPAPPVPSRARPPRSVTGSRASTPNSSPCTSRDSTQRARHAKHETRTDEQAALRQHHSLNLAGVGAEAHANADFVGARAHRERQHRGHHFSCFRADWQKFNNTFKIPS